METVGILGLGRMGRDLFRLLYRRDDLDLIAVADLGEAEPVAYLLRFDTLRGRIPDPIAIEDGHLAVAGRRIRFYSGKDQPQIPWGDLGVETVLEATSEARSRRELEAHLEAGARRVIACAPTLERPDLLAVAGIGEERWDLSRRVVSAGSPTIHALAPALAVLEEAFGVERAHFTAIHSYSSHHRLSDVPAEDLRRGRSAAENIIPQASRSAALVPELFPRLEGRVTGAAMNVPVANGSAVDLTCWQTRTVTTEAVREAFRVAAASARWKGVLAYETEPIVSSDVEGSPFSAVFDSQATATMRDRVSKTFLWFDSTLGHAHRVVELVGRLARADAP